MPLEADLFGEYHLGSPQLVLFPFVFGHFEEETGSRRKEVGYVFYFPSLFGTDDLVVAGSSHNWNS